MKEKLKKVFQLFITFIKIGAFTFGGGYAMVPLIQRETVEKKKWINDDDILEIVAIAESTPGPIAVNSATFVGYKTAGVLGAAAATIGVVLPSFTIIYFISFVIDKFENNTAVKYAFSGIRAGVLALIIKALWAMSKKNAKNIISFIITAFAFIFAALNINVIYIILACAVTGIVSSLIMSGREKKKNDDITFMKIGALTFGGGYAMLPLIHQEVLENGWLTEEQILNFIAVSESTPGPFAINIATYIGTETGGLLGAVSATAGVVLPSFIIILIVAGFFSAFRKNKIVSGAMTGLKPAVIGLIAAAVLTIGKSVFFPSVSDFDLSQIKDAVLSYHFIISLLIFASALVLTFSKKKINPIAVIIISAALGISAGYIGELI